MSNKEGSAIKTTVIAGIFGIITAIISASATYYLPIINLSPDKLLITENGKAKEINLNNILQDFTANPKFNYELTNVEIKITSKDKVIVKSTLSTTDIVSKKNLSGSLTGTGVYEDGMAYVIYSIVFKDSDIKWKGVAVLKIPRGGEMKGYWMTEDILTKGKFSFGEVSVDR